MFHFTDSSVSCYRICRSACRCLTLQLLVARSPCVSIGVSVCRMRRAHGVLQMDLSITCCFAFGCLELHLQHRNEIWINRIIQVRGNKKASCRAGVTRSLLHSSLAWYETTIKRRLNYFTWFVCTEKHLERCSAAVFSTLKSCKYWWAYTVLRSNILHCYCVLWLSLLRWHGLQYRWIVNSFSFQYHSHYDHSNCTWLYCTVCTHQSIGIDFNFLQGCT